MAEAVQRKFYLSLSHEDRLELIGQLEDAADGSGPKVNGLEDFTPGELVTLSLDVWASLVDEGYDPPISDDDLAELKRRIRDFKEHPERALSWEQFCEQMGWDP